MAQPQGCAAVAHHAGQDAVADRLDHACIGIASIGGTVILNAVDGYAVRDGDTFTILTAEGGVDGTFESPDLSAILTSEFTYGPQSVQLTIEAGSYLDVIDPASTTPVSVRPSAASVALM